MINHIITLNKFGDSPLLIPVCDDMLKTNVWRINSNNHELVGRLTPTTSLKKLQVLRDWFNPDDESFGILISGHAQSDMMTLFKLCLD